MRNIYARHVSNSNTTGNVDILIFLVHMLNRTRNKKEKNRNEFSIKSDVKEFPGEAGGIEGCGRIVFANLKPLLPTVYKYEYDSVDKCTKINSKFSFFSHLS